MQTLVIAKNLGFSRADIMEMEVYERRFYLERYKEYLSELKKKS